MVDDRVRRAMEKWPNVPAAFGWLSLDRRGTWMLEGKPVRHPRTVAFFCRNYRCDNDGGWYVQNGPQRAYVTLAYAPLVVRLRPGAQADHAGSLIDHTGHIVRTIKAAAIDEEGSLLVQTEHGPSLIDDRDLGLFVGALRGGNGDVLSDDSLNEALVAATTGETGRLALRYGRQLVGLDAVRQEDMPARFGFVTTPAPAT